MKPKQRRSNRVNLRSVHNLCPNCFSQLKADETGGLYCTGDKLQVWQGAIENFLKLDINKRNDFLETLDNPSGFINSINFETGIAQCGFNSKISPVASNNETMVPDPMAVGRLERQLKRRLTEIELEPDYVFNLDGKEYRLPLLKFPEDF